MLEFTRINTKEDRDGDIEQGSTATLYPGLSHGENILRWGFIRKVYGILAAQMVLTTAVSFLTVLYAPINELLRGNSALLLFLVFLPFILLWPLHVYQQKHPLNLVFLGLFTASLSLTVGVSCANTDGKIVLEALILTSAVVSSLTAYTFWASKKGKDFSFLGPILFTSLVILLVTSFMQVFFPHDWTSNQCHYWWIWCSVVFWLHNLRHRKLD
ncbi:BI1-like protein isoform X3 [Bidens hawaiensis]|uniref:BI1-like protein isoform X3 n=1 Tax=Bidens hawaiensis TaxID=980011 RepID=UPI00404A2C69